MAEADDVQAMTEQGKALLSGPEPQTFEALELLNAAAHGTGGEAAAIVAVMAAAGAGTPQSWPNALDYLGRATRLGWGPAQAQMLILAGDRALADRVRAGGATDDEWRVLRRSVDIDAWLAPPPPGVLSQDPYVAAVEGFARPDLCAALVELSQGRLAPARVYDSATGSASVAQARSNSSIDFPLVDSSLLLMLIRAKIAVAAGAAIASLEPPSILHYAVGQQFAPHFDFLEPDERGLAAELATKGQRTGTFLVYLNDDFDGGETDFPRLGVRFKGCAGDAIHFLNTDSSGAPDRRTLHAGLAPSRGEKWLFSQWIRSASA